MRIIVDISHPAHVHLFRNLAKEMIARGHTVMFTAREKDCTIELLKYFELKHVNFGKNYKSFWGKIWGLFRFSFLLIRESWAFKPDIYISHSSVYASIASFFTGKPHISLDDTGNNEQLIIVKLFSKIILTSECYHKQLGRKQIRYNSFHELAYLHPDIFVPNPSNLKYIGTNEGEPYVILRFVSWNASHDMYNKGLSLSDKKELVEFLEAKIKIFISAESELPAEFEKYKLNAPPEAMHDLLYYASLYIGEGATMASESALLGTPSIYINTSFAGTILDQSREGFLFWFKNYHGVKEKATEVINTIEFKESKEKNRKRILKNHINLTRFLIWFIENYPSSLKNSGDYTESN